LRASLNRTLTRSGGDGDDDDDMIFWRFRALAVPLHLGLTDSPSVPHDLISAQDSPVPLPQFLKDSPSVPHNLISAQDSPVPLTKFQMASRLKILMSSESKKGTQIYYHFLSKCPSMQIPSRFPNGALVGRDACLQGIFTFLLIYFFISKALRKQRHSMFPKLGACMETDAHTRALLNTTFRVPMETDAHSRALLNIPLRVPSKGVFPPCPLMQPPQRETPRS
jgi:hypothetical protein